jgi:galactofuranose transport system ATP-binding protein
MKTEFLLEINALSKNFPGVRALGDVDFAVRRGEVHALMGENGAGKSTLIKILSGIYQRDSGDIVFDGENINPHSALQAQQLGISTIFQELNLIPYLDVCENIFIGREPKKFGLIDWRKVERKTKEILKDMGLEVDIDIKMPLYRQSIAIQQMVAIARAISIDAKLLVMDEPTSSLNENEVNVLFNVIRKLKNRNISVIFITHKVDEVFEICDRTTILKDGQLVGVYELSELTKIKLISSMLGRDATSIVGYKKTYSDKAGTSEQSICKATHISKGLKVKDVSLDIKKGEVMGLAGLLGSGRTELARILFGDDIPDSGEIEINGKKVTLRKPKDAIQAGVALCPEDRKSDGIVPHMSVADNITLAILPQLSKFGVVSKREQKKLAELYIEKLGIKTPGPDQQIRNLSGGNQQKVLLAKWLVKQPLLIILDEPTRGIDVGAKMEIETLIQKLADDNISVLMISSEMEELIRGCDKITVLRDGEKAGELVGAEISDKKIMGIIARGNA